jgi:hypothetical protein
MRNAFSHRALLAAALSVAASCSVVRGVADAPGQIVGAVSGGQSKETPIDLAVVASDARRFADRIASRVDAATVEFAAKVATPEGREQALNWRLTTADHAYQSATQARPIAALADLVTQCVYQQRLHELHWRQVYGEADTPLVEVWTTLRQQGLESVDLHLGKELGQSLRTVIENWQAASTDPQALLRAGAPRFEDLVDPGQDTAESGSLFATLGLNPLDSLEPAAREIAATRELAERAVYLAQRAPRTLSMRAELLTLQLTRQPDLQSVLQDLERTSKAVESVSAIADALPEKLGVQVDDLLQRVSTEISTQRAGIVTDLETTSASTQALLASSEKTLDAATRLAQALEATAHSVGPLLAHFATPEPEAPKEPEPPGKPFDPAEYTALAAQLTTMIQELNAAADRVDRLMPVAQRNLDEVATRADLSVARTIHEALRFALITIAAVVAGVVVLRFVPRRRTAA